MKAIILARVSTEEQKEAGNSLPAQIDRLEAYSKRKGFEVVETFSFDESAYKEKRDEFDKILDYLGVHKEKIAVCFDKVDRFSRNVFDKRVAILYELAMKGEIELHFASDNLVISPGISATEKFHFGMSLGLAKYYSDAVSDNTKRAFERKRKNGEWTGKAPIGYINTTDEKGAKNIVPDPAKAHLVQRLFELYAAGGHSFKTLRSEAAKMGLKASTGKPIAVSLIAYTLGNSFYYGEAVSKGVRYWHKYEPLIGKDLFDRCQAVRTGWKKKPFQYAAKPFVFRGLLQCARCGCTITPEIKKGRFVYYSCTNYRKQCERVYVPEKDLLKPVYEALEGLQQLPQETIDKVVEGLRIAHVSETAYHGKAIAILQQEYNDIQVKVDRLLDILIAGSITNDIHDKKLKEYKERQYEIGLELDIHTRADEGYHVTAATILNLAKRALDIFESSEPQEKRTLLQYLLQNPQVDGKKLTFSLRKPFDTVLTYANRPTWLRTVEAIRTWIQDDSSDFYVPTLRSTDLVLTQ